MSSIKWFGLNYDEGPDIGGQFKPYRQSERLQLYKKYAQELLDHSHAYYCFCDSDRLNKMRAAQIAGHKPTIYDGTCKNLDPDKSSQRAKKEKFVIRLKIPDKGETSYLVFSA